MRVCVVYDCLFPHTRGGGERWYRSLSEGLLAQGHEVTYLTRRQWPKGGDPDLPGAQVIAVSPAGDLYGSDGARRTSPPLLFGAGVFWHLVRHRRRYDAVHVCSFPFFALLGARLALLGSKTVLGVDWLEVWSRSYWDAYVGPIGGWIGWWVQRLCVRVTPLAFTYARLTEGRLHELGLRSPTSAPGGLLQTSAAGRPAPAAATGTVLLVGRLIPEKRAHLLPAVVAELRRRGHDVDGAIVGDGPERAPVAQAIADASAPVRLVTEFLPQADLDRLQATALCLLVCSVREGWGLVVVEAAAAGTPVVVVAAPDNAAVDLVADGENGVVATGDDPGTIADAVERVLAGGDALRAATRAWFEVEADRLDATQTALAIAATYQGLVE